VEHTNFFAMIFYSFSPKAYFL